jgi:hypothetical protein
MQIELLLACCSLVVTAARATFVHTGIGMCTRRRVSRCMRLPVPLLGLSMDWIRIRYAEFKCEIIKNL